MKQNTDLFGVPKPVLPHTPSGLLESLGRQQLSLHFLYLRPRAREKNVGTEENGSAV